MARRVGIVLVVSLVVAGGVAVASASPARPSLHEPVAAAGADDAQIEAAGATSVPAGRDTSPEPAIEFDTAPADVRPSAVDVQAGLSPSAADDPVSSPVAEPAPISTHSALLSDAVPLEIRRPVAVAIDDLEVFAAVDPAGVDRDTGELDVPDTAGGVVWYEHGPSPGDTGSAVLAGHVDLDGREGVFFELGDLEVGSIVHVAYDDGSSARFEVIDRRRHEKAVLPTDEIFRRDGAPALVLITCGGDFDSSARSYRDNVVVTAVPTSVGAG